MQISSDKIIQLRQSLHLVKSDSEKIIVLDRFGFYFDRVNADSSLKYFKLALSLAREKSFKWAEARTMASLSSLMINQGNFAEAFDLLFTSLKIAESINSAIDIARAHRRISGIYWELLNYRKAADHMLIALRIDQANHFKDKVAIDHYALGDAYEKLDQLDSATYYVHLAFNEQNELTGLMQAVYRIDGNIKLKKRRF